MESMNYSNARAVLSQILDKVSAGQAIEITKKGEAKAVIISKLAYEKYKKMEFAYAKQIHDESIK
ncbi:prevent-host-death protein [Acinetobacter sp. Ac_877]|uniref:type II toxin-antitoxin system prevent-host-death family antitoxin n=1 Tax=Acinetobacter portensis TaxID=1839785 RepID=UPI00128CAE2E|nr:type II toxin-antitoxin system prevent-host-death family antitoxin [Acinetobacter portensis]MPW40635.1 prevent-host-death protein [Acinetobacter portensis]